MSDPTHTLSYQRFLLADPAREHYRRAILEVVRPGQTVADVGSGCGVLSYFACQAGASRVYAVELDAVARLAPEIGQCNGIADRVEFIQAHSAHVELPERVDVVVSDTLGSFGLDGQMLGALVDARQRFLKPGGQLVPRSLRVFLAPVEVPDLYRERVDFWLSRPSGLDCSPLRRYAVNNYHIARFGPDALLGEPAEVLRVDFTQATGTQLRGEVELVANRAGTMHGLGGWFSLSLSDEVEFSNNPTQPTTNYARAFLPMGEPKPLEPGDRLAVTLQTHDGEAWTWRVAHRGPADAPGAGTNPTWRFDHSTFWGFPLPAEMLRQRQLAQQPLKLSHKGRAALELLNHIDGSRSQAQLESELLEACAGAFQTKAEAAAFVRDLLERYTAT